MRNDKGYWLRVEEYLRGRSALQFSHGLCPDCMQRLYPEVRGDRTPEKGGAAG